VTKPFVASSWLILRELSHIKVPNELGLQLLSEWIPSVANKLADALTRCFLIGDLAARPTLWRSVVHGIIPTLDSFQL
jgi:hypothetical protein